MVKRQSFLKLTFIIFLLSISMNLVSSQVQTPQVKSQKIIQPNANTNKQAKPSTKKIDDSLEPVYTENIEQFKSNKYNARLQILVGCWLMTKQYIDNQKSANLLAKNWKAKDIINLKLVKECMKHIKRKQAVVKVTQLVGKNMQQAKKYQDLIDEQRINEILAEENEINLMSLNRKQQSQQTIVSLNNESIITTEIKAQNTINKVAVAQSTEDSNDANQQQVNTQIKILNQFDIFLQQLLKKYQDELGQLMKAKGGLKGKVEEELKARGKYYFGFIPANSFTHSLFLVTISLSMVFCCTCYKYYKKRTEQTQDKKKQATNNTNISYGRSFKKLSKMTEMTMNKKGR